MQRFIAHVDADKKAILWAVFTKMTPTNGISGVSVLHLNIIVIVSSQWSHQRNIMVFSAANLALAGFPQTNALGENLPSRYLNMFNLRLCNATTIRYSILKSGHMHFCGKGYKYLSPHCCKCNSFGNIAAIRYGNACHGPHSDSVYSGSEHRQFNSPRLVKHEAGFPSPRRVFIGSNQLWRVNDSPYYRELMPTCSHLVIMHMEYDRMHILTSTYIGWHLPISMYFKH